MQLHFERLELAKSSVRLLRFGEELAHESDVAIDAVAGNHEQPCSDRDMQFMRNKVFASEHIRDIGRTGNEALLCSSGVGRFSEPLRIDLEPDIAIEGRKVWVSTPLVTSTAARGFVIERRNVSVVLNPEIFKSVEDPAPRFSTGYVIDPNQRRMVLTSGEPLPLTMVEILSGRFIERKGVLYQPDCSAVSYLCTVTGESTSAAIRRGHAEIVTFSVIGGLLGGLCGILLLLLAAWLRSPPSQLRRAVRRGALNVAYQPVVDLDSGKVVGAEALVRWSKEDGEMIAPDTIISLAETRGFVTEVTRVMMRKVVAEVGDLMAKGELRITLNITAQDLVDGEFFLELGRCLKSRSIEPRYLGLELTERSTAEHGVASEALARLKKAGYSIYIDDFGTGYSSLAYLHRLAVDAIKIDRAFTQTVGTDAVTASVVPQILAMAEQLDLQVVVEGIETIEQAEFFRKRRAGLHGQGWLYSKPLPAAELRRYLKNAQG